MLGYLFYSHTTPIFVYTANKVAHARRFVRRAYPTLALGSMDDILRLT
jgi:hypothetical protein